MEERERIRLRKEAGEAFPWTADWVLSNYKFTNVKREHDATTRWMRTHWTGPHLKAAAAAAAPVSFGVVLFNCALFRFFGTQDMGARLRWVAEDEEGGEGLGGQGTWRPEEVVKAATELRAQGKHAFTGAYCKVHRNTEASANHEKALQCYEKVCFRYLSSLWQKRHHLSRVATETRSWRAIVGALREKGGGVLGLGGTGFMAKEVVLDAMHAMDAAVADADADADDRLTFTDRDEWCPCGPGARRGLNRIFGRPTDLGATDTRASVEEPFIAEMRALLELARREMPGWCAGLEFELHDIQFQLCEFDKYQRRVCGERGASARYVPKPPPPSNSPPPDHHENNQRPSAASTSRWGFQKRYGLRCRLASFLEGEMVQGGDGGKGRPRLAIMRVLRLIYPGEAIRGGQKYGVDLGSVPETTCEALALLLDSTDFKETYDAC